MEWVVKTSCYNKTSGKHTLVLNVLGGSLKMLADVKTDVVLNAGDILSPVQNALYCINRKRERTLKILDARRYTCEEWAQLQAIKEKA
jgi:signal transduction protein PmrD